jgi:hypothetical protein
MARRASGVNAWLRAIPAFRAIAVRWALVMVRARARALAKPPRRATARLSSGVIFCMRRLASATATGSLRLAILLQHSIKLPVVKHLLATLVTRNDSHIKRVVSFCYDAYDAGFGDLLRILNNPSKAAS